ncbi:hypothetical protein OROMI_010495 [Orobanche minor]
MDAGRAQQSRKRSRKRENDMTNNTMLSNTSSVHMDFSPYILESSDPLAIISASDVLDTVPGSVKGVEGNFAPSGSLNILLRNQPKRRKQTTSFLKDVSSNDQLPTILESFSIMTTQKNKGEHVSSSGQGESFQNPYLMQCIGNPYIDMVNINQFDGRGHPMFTVLS